MQIISPTGISAIKVIPRSEYQYLSLLYTNVSTDMIQRVDISDGVYTDNYLEFNMSEATKTALKTAEGQFINLEIYGSSVFGVLESDLVYRGRMFATTQPINQVSDETYSVNKDVYNENESQNEYIIL